MAWPVLYHAAFVPELEALPPAVKREVLAKASLLMTYGPTLGRPYVDTLAGSRFANMKEMRFRAGDGVWRVAFAFDVARQAVLLVAGDKGGAAQGRFYTTLIRTADDRFADHLATRENGR